MIMIPKKTVKIRTIRVPDFVSKNRALSGGGSSGSFLSRISGTNTNPGNSFASQSSSPFFIKSQIEFSIGATILPPFFNSFFHESGILSAAPALARILSNGPSARSSFVPSPHMICARPPGPNFFACPGSGGTCVKCLLC